MKTIEEIIKKDLENLNKCVEVSDEIRSPYSKDDIKMKKILIFLEEGNCDIFKDILDYITNLQEELSDYATRNEKAIEYIKSLEEDSTDYDGEVIIGEIGTHCKNKLLNILNGGDEE